MMQKINVAVLFGGRSPEYGVSLESAYAVITHMRQYNPVMVGITREGNWFHFTGTPEQIKMDTWHTPAKCAPTWIAPNQKALYTLENDRVHTVPLDAAFPVLHGRNGEDGTVQGLLELAHIPVVGCGVLASALCMDKDRAHKLAQAAGAAVPASAVLGRRTDLEEALSLAERLGYPLFVKPLRAGSSYGITRAANPDQLPAAIALALEYDSRVILEEAVSGFEVGCAVLGNDTLTVGELDEIELSDGFFDFTEKYTLKTSAIHVPARVSPAKTEEIKETARKIYKALGCRGFARVDMFLDNDGRIVFNEVNTIPGFTAHSRYPSMMRAAGMSFEQVISAVIELAVRQ